MTKPKTCSNSSQCHTAFKVPSSCPVLLFPGSLALTRSWLFRLPVSCPVPSSYGPPWSCVTVRGRAAYGGRREGRGGWEKMRLTASGAGVAKRREGVWSKVRLTVARRGLCCCLQTISTTAHETSWFRSRIQGAGQNNTRFEFRISDPATRFWSRFFIKCRNAKHQGRWYTDHVAEAEEDARRAWSRVRLTSGCADCTTAYKRSVLLPISQVAFAEEEQGADQTR